MPNLYIVATPIGNLEDLTLRALRILKEVNLILSEDTRVTKKLLNYYQIKTPTLSYHQHSKIQKLNYIIGLLKKNKKLALVTDAGTPGISDPGNKLINLVIKQCSNLIITPIPGPSAITAAASVSGFPMDRFLFLGFPPNKNKRKKFFAQAVNSKYPVIFYESPYRIIKTLKELELTMKQFNNEQKQVVVCRELTKKFEEIFRGHIKEVIKNIQQSEIKGEFVIIIQGKNKI